ncbi:conserved hypothetical protein [Rhodopseudomonas palustris TIE-1]|uniref:phage tail tube protein n=1 Tax=Rhodopseudomonas palustris TaxID=1076 RepID=UPI000164A9F3|nr:hypothetical protein [Rhodopseudomonas palustris]ACF01851.1 conserved hypothetical protein [Rhodopseudomonas palustris TIE-1]
MFDSVFFRKMVLLAKLESDYATDPTLTGAANAILGTDIALRPMEGQDVARNLIRDYLSGEATIPAGLHVIIEFSTELAGSGTPGTAPAWGPLMRGCGCAEVIVANTSVAYTPISEDMESLYVKFWLGDTLHALKGARGDATISLDAQGIPRIRWTFTGLWVAPTEVSRPATTLTGFKKPKIAAAANTPTFELNSVALALRSWSLKLGNKVEPRLLVNVEKIIITDRAEALDCTVEVTPLTDFDPFALAAAQTLIPAEIVHGTVAGNIATIAAPTCQLKRPGAATNNQGIAERVLSLTPLPSGTGNDQFSLTLT